MSIDVWNPTVINLNLRPYYVAYDNINNTAYVLSSSSVDDGFPESEVAITPITYRKASGFQAGETVNLSSNGLPRAITTDPRSRLIYGGTRYDPNGDKSSYGVKVYDPSQNFKQTGFIPLPVPNAEDVSHGLIVVQMGFYNNKIFVGADNEDPKPGASGLVYIIDPTSPQTIKYIQDIEPTGEGMRNFSFYENRLYYTNYNSKNLICIDIGETKVASITDVSDGHGVASPLSFPGSISISPSKQEIYIGQFNGGMACSIKTMNIQTKIPSPIGHIALDNTGMYLMGIDDESKFIAIATGVDNGVVNFVNTTEDKQSNKLNMQGSVYGLAIDEGIAFIANATQKKVFCYKQKYIDD